MESRRIQRVGERSFNITLPKRWMQERKLQQHDLLYIESIPNGDLLISTRETTIARSTMEINTDEVDSLPEFIVLCYVKNIQCLRIKGQLDYNTVTAIKKKLSYLEGYSITNEDERGMEISFLFSDISITIPTIIQRMVYLLKLSLSAAERQDQQNLDGFEASIDRLHNLSKRIIGACTTDSALRDANGISDLDTIFFLRIITKRLESIGDRIAAMIDHKPSKEDLTLIRQLLEFLDRSLIKHSQTKGQKAEFLKLRKQVKGHNGVARIFEIAEDIIEGSISIAYNKKYFNT